MQNPLGYFPKEPDDVKPTQSSGFFQVRSLRGFSHLRALNAKTLSRYKHPEPFVTFGRAVSAKPISTDAAEQSKHISISIPEEDIEAPIDTSKLSTIQSSKPEESIRKKIDILNEIEIDDAEIATFKQMVAVLTEETKTMLLNQCVASFMAFDNASAMAQAIMRDGMNVDITVDSSVRFAITNMSKLALVNLFLDKMPLSEQLKQRHLREISSLLATETVESMKKQTTTERYSAMLKHLHANTNNETMDANANPMGTIRKRSGTKT